MDQAEVLSEKEQAGTSRDTQIGMRLLIVLSALSASMLCPSAALAQQQPLSPRSAEATQRAINNHINDCAQKTIICTTPTAVPPTPTSIPPTSTPAPSAPDPTDVPTATPTALPVLPAPDPSSDPLYG